MPEVGIYDAPEVNAFATGPSKSRSLVAVSSGLLREMNRSEAEGVVAHEIAHIANGDMVTMTLVQGVINAFVIFLSRIFGFLAAQAQRPQLGSRGVYPSDVPVCHEFDFVVVGVLLVLCGCSSSVVRCLAL